MANQSRSYLSSIKKASDSGQPQPLPPSDPIIRQRPNFPLPRLGEKREGVLSKPIDFTQRQQVEPLSRKRVISNAERLAITNIAQAQAREQDEPNIGAVIGGRRTRKMVKMTRCKKMTRSAPKKGRNKIRKTGKRRR